MMIGLIILYTVYRGFQDDSKSYDFHQSELLFNKLVTRQPKHAELKSLQTSTQNTTYKIKALPLLPSHAFICNIVIHRIYRFVCKYLSTCMFGGAGVHPVTTDENTKGIRR